MKKSIIFLILAIVFFLISLVLFATLKTTTQSPSCIPRCSYLTYFDAFTPDIICEMSCALNEDGKDYTKHNPIYALFVWLGIISLIISAIMFFMRRRNEKDKEGNQAEK